MFNLEDSTETFSSKEPADIAALRGYNYARIHYDSVRNPIAVKLIIGAGSFFEQNPEEVKRIADYIESHLDR